MLTAHLAAPEPSQARFARGFAAGRLDLRGRGWAEGVLAGAGKSWTPGKRAEFLEVFPFDARTWDIVAASGPATDQGYWRGIGPYGHGTFSACEVERVASKFLEHGRPFWAVEVLALARGTDPIAPSLVADALENCIKAGTEREPMVDSFSYRASELLKSLVSSAELDEQRLAALEWGLLPYLDRHERAPTLLHRALARDPAFFAEVVSLVFRAEDEERIDVTDVQAARARGDSRSKRMVSPRG